MAFEQYYAHGWKQHVSSTGGTDRENYKGCFDCNICLDFAHEPVVTLCGHLYCWPCIYKWLHVQSASLATDEHPQCPVCKADISHTTMVPLYGRGQSAEEVEPEAKAIHRDIDIPPRPSACGNHMLATPSIDHQQQQLPYRNPYQRPNHDPLLFSNYEEDSSAAPLLNLARTSFSNFHHPVVGMIGDLMYTRVFGNSENLYSYRNSYHVTGSSSNRLRRQEMQASKSLNRISIFLLCCVILCVLVF
ncbi:E3 ubiquitin-protein ligase RMA1H1-like [Momordica charantia]|uniref:E3 ubiquitin-protein ligase RMA n=1 Tax=Momordica charantia TaxID=3673 RepID=A0A6J1CKD0_MOMCH|nr:E3 ubiquitin-protein ligase RMA1H1-like [Momordica charantia]XP_022142015.1 E3 ubiquitin-protein ligase RMA1H1-like [Momordica charantia]XP_022142017.1 E3 ubiquitin-protein ligase RMA1H1-like [Momordica charantia]XP_022142018.1 E3 ubiquitin-protein ligase RMA1H1-like [Momordica charantia]